MPAKIASASPSKSVKSVISEGPVLKRAAKAPAKTEERAGRSKAYAELFGSGSPKGKSLNAQGEYISAAAAAREELCLLQYAPKPSRIGWLYVSHGLSEQASGEARLEVLLRLSDRNPAVAAKVLMETGRFFQDTGILPAGALLSGDDGLNFKATGFNHWLACPQSETVPPSFNTSAGPVRFVALLGVTDDEALTAHRVNPQLANGCSVLFEALKTGGVFPISDPTRPCITRRRDFNRLWENAFRVVRGRSER